MEYIAETDEEGNTLTHGLRYRGHVFADGFPKDPETRLDAIENFKCREDDIFICSYPKSGLHWVSNIVTMLVCGDTSYKGSPRTLEYEDFDYLDNMVSPRVLGCHLEHSLLPKEILENKGRMIRVIRNPKDNVVSFYEYLKNLTTGFYRGNFNGFLNFSFQGKLYAENWFNFEKGWYRFKKEHKDLEILIVKYEDLKKDRLKGIQEINAFLQLDHSTEFLDEVAEKVSFKSLKAAHETKSDAGADFTEFMERSAGVLPVYRKGEVGDWKNYFTVAQNEYFDNEFAVRMEECDLNLTYE